MRKFKGANAATVPVKPIVQKHYYSSLNAA